MEDSTLRLTLLTVGAIWFVVTSLSNYPHDLNYFNEAVGGPRNGPWYLRGSSVDWGQDFRYLRWMQLESGHSHSTETSGWKSIGPLVSIETGNHLYNPADLGIWVANEPAKEKALRVSQDTIEQETQQETGRSTPEWRALFFSLRPQDDFSDRIGHVLSSLEARPEEYRRIGYSGVLARTNDESTRSELAPTP